MKAGAWERLGSFSPQIELYLRKDKALRSENAAQQTKLLILSKSMSKKYVDLTKKSILGHRKNQEIYQKTVSHGNFS
jgi:hypothetical protein